MGQRNSYRRSPRRRRNRMARRLGGMLLVLLLVAGILRLVMKFDNTHPSGEENSRAGVVEAASGIPHYEGLDRVNGGPAGSVEKEYEGFRLSFNPSNGTPDWVAWELLRSETDGDISRSNKFHTDYEVEGCPDTKDYSNSGYDRGHLCPAADQKWSSQAMSDCFYMTNMAPQKHELNAGAWKTLEEKERLWAKRDSALVIVAGPIYTSGDRERIGAKGVRVPGAFFKCIVAPYLAEPRGIAFIYNNARCPGNMADYAVSIDEVERLTGLDFFHNLPDEVEERVESQFSFREWN